MSRELILIELVHTATFERGCFACGGDVMGGYDKADPAKDVYLCGRCGEVEDWVETDQHGAPVQGFLPLAEAAKWTVPHHHDGQDMLF